MLGGLINSLDSFFMWLSTRVKHNFADYCDLETAQDNITLVAKDGSLISVIRLNGIKNLINNATFFTDIVEPLTVAFQTHLDKNGHAMQFWFSRDPEKSVEELSEMFRPAKETAKRLDLDFEEMLNDKIKFLSNYVSVEENYLVLWSRPSALVKSELSEEKQRKTKLLSNMNTPKSSVVNVQDPYVGIAQLQDRHVAFVQSVAQELGKNSISAEILDVINCCRAIRKSLDNDFYCKVKSASEEEESARTAREEWQPFLPGDPINPNIRQIQSHADVWDVIWPKLSWQVCNKDAEIVDDNYVRVGNTVYAPIYIDLMPKEVRGFGDLFGNLINKRSLPWKISFLIEGDGLSAVSTKGMFASILGVVSNENKLINAGVKHLKEQALSKSRSIVKIRVALCTWAKQENTVNSAGQRVVVPSGLATRVSDLARGVEAWGSCLVSEVTGDPVSGIISSSLAASGSSIATTSAAPLDDIIYMLPLARPCSPWQHGAVAFRSPDGKLMPFQPMSSMQTTWINLIFAKPGSGKSVLMNALNLALCLAPGAERLPRIGIIDIGPSSSGLVYLIKEALPNDKKHLAEYYRIRMTEEYAINPFDTQLGCRFPTSEERGFLVNFLTLLATDPSTPDPEKGTGGLVAAIIDECYLMFSDKEQPKKYEQYVDYKVDEAIKKANIDIDHRTTWWEVVDRLFIAGFKHEAGLAQRYAVPLLSETTIAAKSDRVMPIYKDVSVAGTGESLIQYYTRCIGEILNSFKILARPTMFDLGEARIVSLDLDEVAKSGGPMANKQTAVMYMLSRYILGKDFKLAMETVNEMPYPAHLDAPADVPVKKYREHHLTRIEQIKDDYKRLCFDEFHRTSTSEAVKAQVIVDMREGRKWNLDVTLASQSLDDFNETMREFATSIFIMDGGNNETIEKIKKVFGVENQAEIVALKRSVTGPSKKGGGVFLAKFSTKQGWFTQLLNLTLASAEIWAFSTTAEDVAIRNRLYRAIGQTKARRILAQAYPHGSAKDDVEMRRKNLKEKGGMVADEEDDNLYDQIVQELLQRYKSLL